VSPPLEVEFEEEEGDGVEEEDDGVVSFGGSVPAGLILNASLSPIDCGGVAGLSAAAGTGYALSTQLSPVGDVTGQSYFLLLVGTDATIPCSPTNVVLLGVLFDS